MNKVIFSFATIMLIILLSGAVAYESDAGDDPVKTSRITYVSGDAVIQPSISGNTLEAALNMPFMIGDRLATGTDGRIEFRLGDGMSGWLWHDTKIELTESAMDQSGKRQSVIRVWYGAISVRRLDMSSYDHVLSVNTGSGRITLSNDTLIRVTMESDLTAIYVTVHRGKAIAESAAQRKELLSGETWRSTAGSGQWEFVSSPAKDAFDDWFIERDNVQQNAWSEAQGYPEDVVPHEYMDQAAGLHGYGRWVFIQHTWYWAPFVSSSWVPYHFGYWDFIPSWGWFWVPFEPWGWTAYRYGYWRFFAGYGWMWYPNWRWRGHHAHWRYTGRSVHWVAAHPDDDMDSYGNLRSGAIPINSKLAIGIPVEAGQQVDQMLNRIPVQRNAIGSLPPADNAIWRSELPENLRPSAHRRGGTDHSIGESSLVINPYARGSQRLRPTGSQMHQRPPNQMHSPQPVRTPEQYCPMQPNRQRYTPSGTTEIHQRPGRVGRPESARPQQHSERQQLIPHQNTPGKNGQGEKQGPPGRPPPRRPPSNQTAPQRTPESLNPDTSAVLIPSTSVLRDIVKTITAKGSILSPGRSGSAALRSYAGKAAEIRTN
jgi:hypothetical protein